MTITTAPLRSNPGIKRDGTRFEGDFYVDGQWVRFQRGLPRKIGGYRAINSYLTEVSRGFNVYPQQSLQYCHTGSANLLERFTLDSNYSASVVSDRTPAALTASDANMWMFANAYDSSTTDNQLFAHVSPNLDDINNTQNGEIYAGALTGTSALTAVALPVGGNATGGIVALHPYLFFFGSDGIIGWSVAGNGLDLTGSGSGVQRPWGQKFIKGMPLRAGAGNTPAGIFWAYDAVIRASFEGGATVFGFDTLASDTSIMSPNCVVDYDGVFYWVGVDRFFLFNGVVRDVPNTLNANYFFDGLNTTCRSKVFAFKVPRFGEIWWCYPRGSATECSHAVIYNVREETWYDTELPEQMRASGAYSNTYAKPILLDATLNPQDADLHTGYHVWLHESGVDEIHVSQIRSIPSYFETGDLSAIVQGQNTATRISRIEPDFVQSGPMSVQITGRANARSPEVTSTAVVFPATATEPYEQIVAVKEQRRELRVRFESNAVGGDYQMGQIIGHFEPGDGTVL